MFKRLLDVIRAILTGNPETRQTPAACPDEPRRVEGGVVPDSSSPMREDRSPSRERIAVHAYHRWLSRGKPIGTDWEDWFDAERDLQVTA